MKRNGKAEKIQKMVTKQMKIFKHLLFKSRVERVGTWGWEKGGCFKQLKEIIIKHIKICWACEMFSTRPANDTRGGGLMK